MSAQESPGNQCNMPITTYRKQLEAQESASTAAPVESVIALTNHRKCNSTIGHLVSLLLCTSTYAFWDFGTTTPDPARDDVTPRQSFFRWQKVVGGWLTWGLPEDVKAERNRRMRLFVIAGISIDRTPLATAVILNRRTLITAANYLEPHMVRQRDLRIWTLGRGGLHITPFRYRVWRVRRLFPRSLNPEHCHGIRCEHSPRHDVAIIHTMDPLYLYTCIYDRWQYAFRGYLTNKHKVLDTYVWFVGSGYEYSLHIKENYKIFYTNALKKDIVNCEMYLPKWWGKFICVRNTLGLMGLQNGGGLFTTNNNAAGLEGREWDNLLVGLACFEIRYNQDRIYVFTDLRYYVDYIKIFANITFGEYYEYAYPEFSVYEQWFEGIYSGDYGRKFLPEHDIRGDYFPLGK